MIRRSPLFWITSPVWFTICLIGAVIRGIGHLIWCLGAWIHDLLI